MDVNSHVAALQDPIRHLNHRCHPAPEDSDEEGLTLIGLLEDELPHCKFKQELVQLLYLTGKARNIWGMELMRKHEIFTEWLMLPVHDRAMYREVPDWAFGPDQDPKPMTMEQFMLWDAVEMLGMASFPRAGDSEEENWRDAE